MFMVVALGYWAGEIIDRLRADGTYDDIRFIFCDTDEGQLMAQGNENDEHILLTDIAQCREAIHDDNERMGVLVTTLNEDCSLQYASEVMSELWNCADRTYCFATIPFYAGGKRVAAIEVFKATTCWSDISIAQDMLKMPDSNFFIDYYDAIAKLLALVLKHPRKGLSEDRDKLPFGVWATEKQVFMALNAFYSNNHEMESYYNAGTFSFHKSTHEY